MNEKVVRVGTGVMVLKDEKVLLGHRMYSEEKIREGIYGHNTWTLPGGAMEFGESPRECAVRETKEETGLTIKELELISVGNDYFPPTHFVTIGFLAENFEGELANPEPHKFREWKWFSLKDLPEPLFAPTERIIENYYSRNIF